MTGNDVINVFSDLFLIRVVSRRNIQQNLSGSFSHTHTHKYIQNVLFIAKFWSLNH